MRLGDRPDLVEEGGDTNRHVGETDGQDRGLFSLGRVILGRIRVGRTIRSEGVVCATSQSSGSQFLM